MVLIIKFIGLITCTCNLNVCAFVPMHVAIAIYHNHGLLAQGY